MWKGFDYMVKALVPQPPNTRPRVDNTTFQTLDGNNT